MKKICTLIFGMILFQFSFAQVQFDISDASGNVGQEVSFDVRISNFTDIASLQFSINWDADVMEFVSIENITDELPQFGISFFGTPDQPSIDEGELAVTWNLTSTQGITIDEQNHLMFTLVCQLTGAPGDNSSVFLSGTPRVIEFIDGDGNVVGTSSNDGTAMVNGGTNTDVQYFVGSDNVMIGENFCIPVTANNFTNINFTQIPFQYDETKLDYTGVTNEFFNPIVNHIATPNESEGTVRIIVQDATFLSPLTMPNGETLFEVCFTAIGPSGTSTPITLDDITDVPPSYPLLVLDEDGEEIGSSKNDGTVIIQGGSSDVTFYFDDIEVELGTRACIPVKVRNFSNIQSFQYAMDYNTSDLTFDVAEAYNADLPISDGDFNEIPPGGNIRISWFDLTGVGKAVPNETTLFELCFDVAGDCDMSTALDFTNNIPGGIEITDAQNTVLPFVLDQGSVTIVCSCAINLLSGQSSPATCNGDEDGTITVEADGGNGSYTYNWSNGDTGPTATDGAGTYTVTVSDGENCNTSATFSITEPELLAVVGNVTNETINCNGEISLNVTGGNGGETFMWSDDSTINSPNRTMLCKGDYTVTITDSKGCSTVAAYTVAPKALQIVSVDITDVSCNGGNDGSIVVNVEGGCPAYTVEWSTGNGENLPAGTYTVTITDASTPPNVIMGTYPVTEPDAIVISNPTITNTDMNNMNGAISVDVSGGTGTLAYMWTPGGQDTKDISGITAGKYTLVVTDENSCTVTSEEFCVGSSVVVVSWEDPNAVDGLYNGFGVACNGDCNGELNGEVIAANGNITYTINDQEYTSLPITGLCEGMYNVTYVDEAGLSGNFEFSIIAPDPLTADLTIEDVCSDGTNGIATVSASGGAGEYTYQWAGTTQITASVNDLPAGIVNVVVTDVNNCQFMLTGDEEIRPCVTTPCYTARTVITPNDDGANDEFIVTCAEDGNNTLSVYDRFGRTVYQQANYDNTWKGVDSQGNDLPENGYMWVLEAITIDGAREIYKGTVTILRSTY